MAGVLIACLLVITPGMALFSPVNAVTIGTVVVTRNLPATVEPGETFEVTVTFISDAADFHAILLTDLAPSGWDVSVDNSWSTPDTNNCNNPVINKAELSWTGPYATSTSFTGKYKVTVPGGATAGVYTFPDAAQHFLRYYVGAAATPEYVYDFAGDSDVEILPYYNLILSSSDGGEVTDPGEGTFPYVSGSLVDLEATAEHGYGFDAWTGDVGTVDDVNDDTTTILMSGNYTVSANFTLIPVESGISPTSVRKTLRPGDCTTITKTVTVGTMPPMADIVFAFDLTGSMSGILSAAKSGAGNIMDALDVLGVDVNYGVMSYMDYPHSYSSYCGYSDTYGNSGSGDYAYSLDQPVTDDNAAVTAAINALTLGNGMDGPEAYTRFMYESYADTDVDWRHGARKIVVDFGDNIPHDCNLNEGVTTGTWSTGGDPGRDEIQGNADDLDLQTVLAEMADQGIMLLECHNSASAYWDYWTGITGGKVTITGSGTMVDDVINAVTEGLTVVAVDGLHLEVVTAGFESWGDFTPASYDGVATGTSKNFKETICVPAGTEPGTYTFTVSALDSNGVSYGDQSVEIRVLQEEVEEIGILPPEPAKIGASNLFINPEQVVHNQWLDISANIYNKGETKGTRTVALVINGYLADSQSVGVSPGASQTVVFRIRADSEFLGGIYTGAGTYNVNVEGMEGQFFVLAEPEAPAPTAAGIGGPLGTGGIIAIVVIVILLIGGLMFVLRKE